METAGDTDSEQGRRRNKAAAAFRTIGEAADELELPAHVLRFWESKFPQLQPLKREGGRRYYRPEDIALLRRIRQCLYQEGYTIRGVQKLLGNDGSGRAASRSGNAPAETPTLFPLDPAPQPAALFEDAAATVAPPRRPHPRRIGSPAEAALIEIRQELLEIRALLDGLAGPSKLY